MAESHDDIVTLTKGSRYRIISRGNGEHPLKTIGEFKGYTQFGNDSAICILQDPEKEGDVGMTRIIPCVMVLAIEVLVHKQEEKRKEKEEPKVYFG
jgi:hypothetical protein